MVDIFEKIGEVSGMADTDIKVKFGTNRVTVQKVLKGLLLEQLQEEQLRNNTPSNYSKYKKKEVSETPPKNTGSSGTNVSSNQQKK